MINYFWIEIKGKNVNRLLKQIFKNKINILNIKYYKDKVRLKVSYLDYQKIKEIKTTYEITIIKTSGKKKLLEDISKYKISLLVFIISIFFVIFLSKFTFFIEIETSNTNLKNLIKEELTKNNITVFSLKKDYQTLETIKENIKNNHLDTIEWLEIENKGVKTKVKVIERIKNSKKETTSYKDVVAAKNGYIRKIYSPKGEVVKNIDDYVKKGEIIISGNIHRNEKSVAKVVASGKVYAEVWYIVKVNGNLTYNKVEEKDKGYFKLVLKTGGNTFDLIKIKKENDYNNKKKLFQNSIFSLYLENEKTYQTTKATYTNNELKKILETKAKNSILKTLEKDEYIITQKTLKKTKEDDRMYVEVFFKVYEDIAKQVPIKKEINNDKEKEE